MLKLIPYAKDDKSDVLYIGNPRPIAIHFQYAEYSGILDIELFHDSKEGRNKFLLRLEGDPNEIRVLSEAIGIAIEHPRPHISPSDLFSAAIIDRSKMPESMRSYYDMGRDSASAEVDFARKLLRESLHTDRDKTK